MNEYNFNVNFETGKIKTSLKKLVQNDYNSTKLNFTFDKEGRVVFKMLYPDGGTTYIAEVDNNELILEAGTLSHEGDYEVELSLYTEDSKLTAYATKGFYVRNQLIDTDDVVSNDDRVPILDSLINEVEVDKAYVEGLKEAVERGDFNGADGQDGTDGSDGITPTIGDNGNWYIGDTDTGKPSRGEKGESGEKGEPGATGPQGEQGLQGEKGATGEPGPQGEQGIQGVQGERGYHFTPSVSASGDLSWTNDGNLENPATVNIKGPKGDTGAAGQNGTTPVKGVDYFTSSDIAEIEDDIKEITGELANLDTTDKTNLVSAINEVASAGGESGSLFIDSEENGHDNTIEFINRYLNYGFTDCWVNWGTVLRRIRGVNPTVYSNYVALNIGVDIGIPETPNQTTYYGITYYTAYRFENKIIYVSREEYENKNITEIYENTNLSDVATKGLYTTTRSILKMAVIDETRCPLSIKNTSSYTPTGDYNPATKKYVDDSIAAAITTTLGGSY